MKSRTRAKQRKQKYITKNNLHEVTKSNKLDRDTFNNYKDKPNAPVE